MICDKIIVIFVALFLLMYLSKRYIRRYAPENLIIISLLIFSMSMYATLSYNNMFIPAYIQILVLVFGIFVPFIATYLQYNNIILSKKILYSKVKLAYISKNYQKAISLIEKVVTVEGRSSEMMYILGMCYKELKDFINARDSFALAVELNKNDYKSFYELGLILDGTNKKDVAITMFNKALHIKKDFYEAEEALGICYTSQGLYKDALKVYKNALKYHPESYEIYYNIGMIEMEIGEYNKAKDAFKKSGDIKPDLYTAHYNLGNLYFSEGNYNEALEAYKKILVSGSYGPKGYYRVALCYANLKEYEKAMGALEYAVELDPSCLEQLNDEYAFKEMLPLIDKYLDDRKVLEKNEEKKKNYMEN